MGAVRFEIVRIRLLRQLGYESAEETLCAAHYRGAPLPSLAKLEGKVPPLAADEVSSNPAALAAHFVE